MGSGRDAAVGHQSVERQHEYSLSAVTSYAHTRARTQDASIQKQANECAPMFALICHLSVQKVDVH